MKQSKPFKFKQFEIIQEANPQKVGTDSMLLGAWTTGDFSRILDIGTGTGILALMLAQKYKQANITAIEPDLASVQEATLNFKNSNFSERILAIQTSLQQFGSLDKFDLIISNPPYFDGTFLSQDIHRNRARHQDNLRIDELYECAAELLSVNGRFNVIIPFDIETEHIERAFDQDLFIQEITHTLSPDGSKKRSLISFGFEDVDPKIDQILVKNNKNQYSQDYIDLTKDFYLKDL